MEYKIANNELSVLVNSKGCEVTSVTSNATGEEYWWNGDPNFWAGHAPILFPACGGLWNGEYRYKGRTYKLPKHGFVKNMEWQLGSAEADSLTLYVEDDAQTREWFPFRFRLSVQIRLEGKALVCEAQVKNLNDETLHYQIGGHPALALPDYRPQADVVGYLKPTPTDVAEGQQPLSVVRAGEQGCWSAERHVVEANSEGLIPISVDTFANEALIYDNHQVRAFSLYRTDGKTRQAEVTLQSPVCLVWQMTDLLCPYVCIEPWFGLCDRQGYTMDLDYRPYTQHTLPQQESNYLLYRVEF